MAVEKYRFIRTNAMKKEGIKGFPELSKALDGLVEPKFRRAALRKAGKVAMTPAFQAIKKKAPVWKDPTTAPEGFRPGDLRDDISMSTSVYSTPRVTKSGKLSSASRNELKVTIKTGKKTEKYALVSEYGRDEHSFMKYTVFGRPVLGFTQTLKALDPEPWMRPTFDAMQYKVVKSFSQELGAAIIQQAKKQKKATGK